MSRWKRLSLFLPVLMLLALYSSRPVAIGAPQANRNFGAHLSGDEGVPPVDTQAQGQIILHLSKDGEVLTYKVIVANIEEVWGAHLHLAPAGVNGPMVVPLFGGPTTGRVSGVLAEGTITASDLTGPLAGQPLSTLIAELQQGDIYTMVHTNDHPGGEIRGQL